MFNLSPLMSNALEVLRDYLQSPISADQSERHGAAWLALNQLQFSCHQLQGMVDAGLQAAKEREELRRRLEEREKTIRILEDVCRELREERGDLRKVRNAALDALAHVANHVGHYGISIDDPANLARTIVAEFDTRIRSRDMRIAELEVKLRRAEQARDDAVARLPELEVRLASAEHARDGAIAEIAKLRNAQAEHYLSVEKVEATESALHWARVWLREAIKIMHAESPRSSKGDEEGQA